MAVKNSDSVPSEFFPGIASGARSTGAAGTQGAGGGNGADSAIAEVTIPYTNFQQESPSHGTVLDGQDAPTALTPSLPDGTGASGSDSLTDHYARRAGQQGRR